MSAVLRFGLMGTAKVAEHGLVKPVAARSDVSIGAVAARDGEKAKAYAAQHHIEAACTGYQAMLDRPDVDAVYLPLANHVHEEWAIKALRAGKHVLCEKPLAANTSAAERIMAEASHHRLVIGEAFAFRHHPFWLRVLELLPELGRVHSIEANYCMPIPYKSWNVYNYGLAGGAMMDTGCYTVQMVRQIARQVRSEQGECEPSVLSATALRHTDDPRVDRAMRARLDWGDGLSGSIHTSIWSRSLVKISLHVRGEAASLHAFNPILPWIWNRITLRKPGLTIREKVAGTTTFDYQLADFAAAVAAGADSAQRMKDAVRNMRVVDAIYQQAGLPLRESQPFEQDLPGNLAVAVAGGP